MTNIDNQFKVKLLVRQARELVDAKKNLQDAHYFASEQTIESNLVDAIFLDGSTLLEPHQDRCYFKVGTKIYSINYNQFKGEIETSMGCNCFEVSDKQSIELCLSHIYTYYSYLTDYIFQNCNLLLDPPYRKEKGIEIPETAPFFEDDQEVFFEDESYNTDYE